jgi:hypothetical protein
VLLLEPADALHELLRGAKIGGGLQLLLVGGYFDGPGTPPVLQVHVDFATPRQRPPQAVEVAHPGDAVAWNFHGPFRVLSHVHMAEEWHVLHWGPLPDGGALLEVEGADAQDIFIGGVGAGQDGQMARDGHLNTCGGAGDGQVHRWVRLLHRHRGNGQGVHAVVLAVVGEPWRAP